MFGIVRDEDGLYSLDDDESLFTLTTQTISISISWFVKGIQIDVNKGNKSEGKESKGLVVPSCRTDFAHRP